ncbi:hypothetical protein A2153_03300 [Candidatus Gottesmanbacteria bacterium RBG_16_38_7b]|uniref:Glycosyl transferase family 1 domain-containing protein n=1 Tax=Candidatus Gottesmanbacteria bacterium RBG_16_38_7b TaxID=1798372 RepID=A0A1F5YL51_9BACT|nr:MAG: hypothetical protein A2153_03300 [Candidatus Gottesmanbacteria bacterium RBG_16_38_7b]
MIAGKIKIALVIPPLSGHRYRGTGTYFQNLSRELKKHPRLEVSEIDLSYPVNLFDLVHFPYFDPFFLTLPIAGKQGKKPQVVSVHDLIPLKYPDHFKKGISGLFKWNMQRNALLKMTHIITDSQNSQKDIISFLGVKKEQVSVIYLGVDPDFKKVNDRNLLQATVNKYHLPAKFILNVGDVNYNKNIPGLINAFLLVSGQIPDLHLVLVGRGFTNTSPQLDEIITLINYHRLEEKIIRLSDLNKEELISLYNLAKVYVQPSFDEGFGLPVLEAMACRTPVLSADSGSLPEIVGRAALLVDPNNYQEMAKNIFYLLGNDDLRQKLITSGSLKANEFTWEKTASRTIRLYASLLGIKNYMSL